MARKPAPVQETLKRLKKAYPEARCTLDFKSPLELLVALAMMITCLVAAQAMAAEAPPAASSASAASAIQPETPTIVTVQVFRPDGAPLARATVTVFASLPNGFCWMGIPEKTDGEGRFTIDLSDDPTNLKPTLEGPRQTLTVRVTAEDKWYGLATGEVRRGTAAPPIKLSLKPVALVSGSVVDQKTSAPVAGVEVIGLISIGEEGYPLSSTTDSHGVWALPIIGTGRMELHVEAATHLRTESQVEVVEGQPLKNVVVKMERGATMRGTLFEADGRTPIAGAKIHTKWKIDETTRESRTDAQGGFVLESLARHQTVLTVTASGYLPQDCPVEVPVDKEPPAQRLVMTQRGGTIQGTVTDGETGKPAAGLLVAACSIEQLNEQLNRSGSVYTCGPCLGSKTADELLSTFGLTAAPHSETDAEGRFELRNVPPGPEVALVLRPNLAPQISEAVTVAEGRTAEEVKIALSRKASGYVAVRLVKTDGAPLVGMKVGYDERPTTTASGQPYYFGELKTDDQGWLYFSVRKYKSCRLTLMVEGCGYVHDEFAPAAGQGYERQYVIRTEKADAEICGRVLKPNGDPAVGAVVVPFIKADRWPGFRDEENVAGCLVGYGFLATTASDGTFVVRGLPPGRYGLMAFSGDPHKSGVPSPAGLAECLPVMVEPFEVGESTSVKDVTMRLGRGAATLVVTTVSAKTGLPLAGLVVEADVRAKMKNMPLDLLMWYSTARTDAKGQARFERLVPGKYDVTVLPLYKKSPPEVENFDMPPGFAHGQELKAGETLEIKIECMLPPNTPDAPDK